MGIALAALLLALPGQDSAGVAKEALVVLQARCWSCHGAEKQSGGLRLDSALAINKGGDSEIGRAHV